MRGEDLPQRVQRFIEREQLFGSDDRLLLAASAGVDSTTLAHVLHELGYRIALAHCNYGLRGQASDEDELFVRQLGDQLGMYVHAVHSPVDVSELGSLQMNARIVRYLHFEKILDEYSYDALVTAHHLDDNLETTLVNLLRGTGLTGLAGMPVRRGRIVRPLLTFSRVEIVEYAQRRGIKWREDRSNETDNYLRNRIRHHLMPLLRDLGLKEATLSRTLERLRAERELLAGAYADWIERITVDVDGHRSVIRAELPSQWSLAYLLVQHIATPYGFTAEQCRQMLALEQRTTLYADGSWVEVSRTNLTFGKDERMSASPATVVVNELPFVLRRYGFRYELSIVDRPSDLSDGAALYLTPTPLPLILRHRLPGDRMLPLGMEGRSRSLKKILNDLKLNEVERQGILLLCSQKEEIMAIAGHRLSEAFRVTATDQVVLRLVTQKENPG